MTKNTTVGISVDSIDKAKIHIVQNKQKYDSLTDFMNKAVTHLIASDSNDTDTDTTQ